MAQALKNLVNKSRKRIAAAYSELERKLKSSAKKEEALEQIRRKQHENEEGNGDFEIILDSIQKKI